MKTKLRQYWWLIALSIGASVAGQTLLKLGVTQPASAVSESGLFSLFALIVGSPLILLGLALFILAAMSWIVVLSKLDLSYAYPFLALTYVLVALVSRFALGESIPADRWVGIGVICAGIVLIARSTN